MSINWQKVFEWTLDHPHQAMEHPVLKDMLEIILNRYRITWENSDVFLRASIFKQLVREMPKHIEEACIYKSPYREEELENWQGFLEFLITREYESEPEKIALNKYKPTLENYVKEIKSLIAYYHNSDFEKHYNNDEGKSLETSKKKVVNNLSNNKSNNKQAIPRITIKPVIIKEMIPEIEHMFQNKHLLPDVLAGNSTKELLKFNGSQNQLVELFRRMCYNNHISENKTQVAKWMSENFQYYDPKGKSHLDLNEDTVYEILTKGKGEAKKSKRICNIYSLPYKSISQLSRMK